MNTLLAVALLAAPDAPPTDAEGFAFLQGEWIVSHQKLKEPLTGKTEWKNFQGKAKFWSVVDGVASVEELIGADGKPIGGAMRTFDRKRRVWSDRWMSASSGVLGDPVEGQWKGNEAVFEAADTWDGKEILSRGTWRRSSTDECTWEQAASLDKGKTWETNWKMRFVRERLR